jgi:acyl-CoA reductase-like NAD-dependent aldehyde dehydrogenase
LAVDVITKVRTQANYLVSCLQARTVWINKYDAAINLLPFGRCNHAGGKKNSNCYGIDEYYEVKKVVADTDLLFVQRHHFFFIFISLSCSFQRYFSLFR